MAAAKKPRTAKRAARKPARTAPRAKPRARASTAPKPARKSAFGGYAISFSGRRETLEQVFGKRPIPPSDMNKKIWAFIRANGLAPPKKRS
ncbi:MAG: hypothetical protein OXU86_03105 [Thaumarchaeota archaeon]|nr:hypothetical protein [Nitrososphaerota archaeon]RNJ71590.1 MAG: hypothetical protein EB824_06740 [Thaumarchaeota archaeon S15]RNJ72952.1 MAG: hypothetical protein EB832_02815 [Thaumarchaeota archaeon S14]MDD9814000.1 hypothetical protein [Nitrososphaerota archaeon]MDD9825753.1 hypothetical protein [Nitrososphaerota archaeon]